MNTAQKVAKGAETRLKIMHFLIEQDLDACGWSEFLQARANNEVAAVHGVTIADLDELSEADIACLDRVWDKFGAMDRWQIRDWTHDRNNVPEWEDPHGSSQPIPLIPSGATQDAGRKHLFVVCTDACTERKHLLTPISVGSSASRIADIR